jgi:hypothetical protein
MREPTEAQLARARATQSLLDTIHQGTEVRATVASLRELRETNHFAELFTETLNRRPRP